MHYVGIMNHDIDSALIICEKSQEGISTFCHMRPNVLSLAWQSVINERF